jgi:quinolinate synthase
MSATETAARWYEHFSRFAEDLYPGRYTPQTCLALAQLAEEIKAKAAEKGSKIAVHNYLLPEFHEIADYLGDSLGLALSVRGSGARRVDFQSVHFMGATAKIILGDRAQVFTCDTPQVLGCSLVFGTDYAWIERWKQLNPTGLVATYVNSDAYAKSISDYVTTSRNTGMIIAEVLRQYPGRKILVLPDKFLGYVMREKALEEFPPERREELRGLVEIYSHPFGGYNACCYVHEKIGDDAPERALDEHPDAELMIHPECGCASSCLYKLDAGILPRGRVYYLSTEQMIWRAKKSDRKKFLVATEKGMIYRLRKEMPEKTFLPVSQEAECRFMKANTLDKLLRSLKEDRYEIVLCDDCCDPKKPYQDDRVVHVPRSVAQKARVAIDRMMEIR